MESDSTSSFSSYSSYGSSNSSSFGSYSSYGSLSDSFSSSVSFSLSSFGSGWSTPSFGSTDDSFSTPSFGASDSAGGFYSDNLFASISSPADASATSLSMFDMPMNSLPAVAAPQTSQIDAEPALPTPPMTDWDYGAPVPEAGAKPEATPAQDLPVSTPTITAQSAPPPTAPQPLDDWCYVPADGETVATPVPEPGPIETRPLAPLPPEPQSTLAKRGDTLWKYAAGDVASIGDLAIRNGLNTSQIITGRTYDTTPMDRKNLSPAEIRVREQIGQAYLNQDNARLATLAAMARQQEANRIAQQTQAAQPTVTATGPVAAGSFAQGAAPQANGLDARFNGFLAEKGGNTFATLAESPGVGLGRLTFNALGFADANPATRAASQSGIGTGVTRYNPGEVSVMGIDNYTVTTLNKGAVGATLGSTVTLGTNGFNVEGIAINKAQSLLTDTMFEVQPNGVGKPGEALRVSVAYKHLGEIGKLQEVRTDGVYAGLNRKEVAVVGASLSGGIGASVEVAAPFMPNRKIGAEASAIIDFTAAETKQISAAGIIADPQTGVYGAAFGVDSRNRLGSAALTVNGGVDIGIARGKLTAKGSGSVYGLGIGGNASAAWNDKTGTLTYQASASYTLGLGAGLDLSGELQSDFAKGIVSKISTLISPPVQPQPRP